MHQLMVVLDQCIDTLIIFDIFIHIIIIILNFNDNNNNSDYNMK